MTKQEGEEEEEEEFSSKVCGECRVKEWKYKCPGCSVRSCSLPCVKSHKIRTLCPGTRNRTEFVPISHFDDTRLLSDFNLLEEIKRVSESAKRTRNRLSVFAYFRLPYHLKGLRNATSGRGTRLQFLPTGMSRRDQNRTRYDHRKKCVYWTIEWRFHSTNAVLLDHEIDENTNIASVIGKHLQLGPWNHRLKKFCDEGLDTLKFFIRKFPKSAKSPCFELDIKVPLRQQLANTVILEYPIIYVFLSTHAIDFEIVKRAPPAVRKPPQHGVSGSNYSTSSPRGVPFKEEEIVDDSCSDPRVLDFTKHENLASNIQSTRSDSTERLLSTTVRVAGESGLNSGTEAIERALFNDDDFDFDQGLIDAYSNLIAEINPDDFLDFDGLISNQSQADEELFVEEDELEEGEIIE